MAARRQDRINEEVARELTSILRTVKDPGVSGRVPQCDGRGCKPRSFAGARVLQHSR